MRPLIGITCSTISAAAGHAAAYRLNQAYVHAVAAAGGAPLLIAPLGNSDATRALFDSLDGLLLPGGADLQPSTYDAAPRSPLAGVDPALDATEIALARWALAEERPVLGICRGQQCLNVAAGGTLFQDIPTEIPGALTHRLEARNALAHLISVEPDSRLERALGAMRFEVNSLHHQSVHRVAPGFLVTALAPDGVIEGIERPDHPFALAVQFHPEELVPGHEPSERLLGAFVEAAAAHHTRPKRRTQ